MALSPRAISNESKSYRTVHLQYEVRGIHYFAIEFLGLAKENCAEASTYLPRDFGVVFRRFQFSCSISTQWAKELASERSDNELFLQRSFLVCCLFEANRRLYRYNRFDRQVDPTIFSLRNVSPFSLI